MTSIKVHFVSSNFPLSPVTYPLKRERIKQSYDPVILRHSAFKMKTLVLVVLLCVCEAARAQGEELSDMAEKMRTLESTVAGEEDGEVVQLWAEMCA